MIYLATIGIFLSIFLIIVLSARGLNIVLAAILSSLVIILTNRMPILESFIGKENSFMLSLTNFLINNFAIFLLGAILANYMEKSGATVSIARFILEKIGANSPIKVMISLTVITSILTYGGISIFVIIFAIIPLAKPIFKTLNISWELFPIPVFLGASTYTMTMLPATPSLHNTIPTKVLGTSLTAAPLLSVIASIIILTFGLIYMTYAVKKSIANQESFNLELDGNFAHNEANQKLPNIFLSITPILCLISVIFIFSKVKNIAVISLTLSIVVAALVFNNYIKSQKDTLNSGATSSIIPAFATSSSVAFGTILTTTAGFEVIKSFLMSLSSSPLVGLSLTTAILSGITGSSSGAIGIVSSTILPSFLNTGISPDVLHRITVIASACLTVVPQSGVMITFHTLSGLSLKRGFKHSFWIVNIGHTLTLIILLIIVALFY